MDYKQVCKLKLRHHLFMCLTLAFFMALSGVIAQESAPEQTYDLPAVSLLGEYESLFADLSPTHGDILLNVCGNDMDIAYERWMEMLGAMEDYATSINYDLKGVKTYLHVFWNPDGSIAHIAFFPKANSRNVPVAELKAVFSGFTKDYRMQIETETGFNHYASGSFPVFDRPALTAKKD